MSRHEMSTLDKFDERVRDWDASLTDVKRPLRDATYDLHNRIIVPEDTVFGRAVMEGELNEQGYRTLCGKINAPAAWMMSNSCPDDLRKTMVNRLIPDYEKEALFRFRGDGHKTCRAVLSSRYMVFNHLDLWSSVLEGIQKTDLSQLKPRVWKPYLQDSMSLWILFEGVNADPDEPLQSYDGGGAGGLKPAIQIRNSEDGTGKIRLSGGMYRSYCANGLIFGFNKASQLERVHVGRNQGLVKASIAIAIAETAEMAGVGIERYVEATREHLTVETNKVVDDWAKKFKISTEMTDQWKGAVARTRTWADLVMGTSDFAGTLDNREMSEEFEELAGQMLFSPNSDIVRKI